MNNSDGKSIFCKCVNENKQWLKCLVAVNVHIRDALLEVLHILGGIPSDPQKLYDFFADKKQQDKNQRSGQEESS